MERMKYLKIELDTKKYNFVVDYQNNYIKNSSMISNVVKNFDILAIIFNISHYFDSRTKLSLNLCLYMYINS